MRVLRAITLASLLILLLPGPARGACSVSSTPINFLGYDVFLASPLDSTGTVTLDCDETPTPDVTVSISQSPNSGGFSPRRMKHAALPDLLDYNLYTESTRVNIWGDGTGGTSTVSRRVPRNAPKALTIYGRVPPLQDAPAGGYLDTLTVTITW
ncbi:MAG TPA: spore coat U domain-containing protein [Thermodesulfobacteriota bacterium]|nr:spore coat U domain-containing protein [Thermodesulfobacteriota bacterium]